MSPALLPKTTLEMSKAFYERATANMNSKLGILSLSRRWDSSLMWSHYSSSHTGFCVGFNREHEFFQDTRAIAEDRLPIGRVNYSAVRPQVPDHKPDLRDVLGILLTKAKDWEYEAEERLLGLLERAHKKVEAKPFDVCLFRVPHESLTEIIVGVNAASDVLLRCTQAAKTLGVPLYRAAISKASFDLERTPVEA